MSGTDNPKRFLSDNFFTDNKECGHSEYSLLFIPVGVVVPGSVQAPYYVKLYYFLPSLAPSWLQDPV